MKIKKEVVQKYFLFLIIILAAAVRLYKVDVVPPGLYQDEAAIGYNAYTILHTGVDEYGKKYPLLFKSFGDYKLPVYIYSTSLSMAIFGKNEFAVRFPSIFFGTVSIAAFYFLLNELLSVDPSGPFYKSRQNFALTAAFLLAIAPWHIQFSRGGFEATEALFFFLIASLLLVTYWRKERILMFLGSIFYYVLTIYTYHPYRIITPLIFILIFIAHLKFKKTQKKHFLAGLIFLILLNIPNLQMSLSHEGNARFMQTSFINEHITHSPIEALITYPLIYLKNYISFFSLSFLFSQGDGIGRHQMPYFGILFYWQLIFILIGLYSLFKLKRSLLKIVTLVLLVSSPLAASFVTPSPHTLRSELMIIPLTILTTCGIFYFLKKKTMGKRVVIVVISIFALFEFCYYLHFYYVHYPKVNALDWGGNYKELVQEASIYNRRYSYLVVDKYFSFAEIYFKFYDDRLQPIYVGSTWKKPRSWGSKKAIYIRPFYGEGEKSAHIVKTIYLPTANNDVFARFWEI